MLINALQSNGTEGKAHIIAQCDGRIYETHVQLIAATSYSLKISEAISHEQEQLLEYWLQG